MTETELQNLIAFLAETPMVVRQLVGALSADAARQRPAANEFSALEHACHLRDIEREGYAVRVLGALVEKQLTTLEYYALTSNALIHACNQMSNRDPVVAYDEQTVTGALESLREQKLVRMVSTAEGRVPKYRHVLNEVIELRSAELALLCVLLLRGPQTIGELRGRTERLYSFSD